MEALKRLERVQMVLSLMQARGISTDHPGSDRFLAEFLLFLVQPCGTLNLEKRCNLINEHLPKVSALLLEEAPLIFTEGDYQESFAELPTWLDINNKWDLSSSKANGKDLAMIGLDDMQRANSTLEDFCRSYFMFHGMEVNRPQSIFKFLPVLSFTESYIYQLDTMNEKGLRLSSKEMNCSDNSSRFLRDTCKMVGNQGFIDHLHQAPEPDPFGPFILLLQHHGLLTDRIRTELKFGTEYWALERKLCHALISKKKISNEDVMRAIHLKSFDYRVLHLLLYQLRGQEVNELHMEFLSVSEFLVEISDDLYDYEDDVIENCFNILRMFVWIYGAPMAPSMLAKCITEAEEKYERLLKTLDPDLSLNYQSRCEEATKEGGKTSGHTLGTWNIPPVIADEDLYRSRFLNS